MSPEINPKDLNPVIVAEEIIDLVIEVLKDSEDHTLICHSTGAVICAEVMDRLPPDIRKHVKIYIINGIMTLEKGEVLKPGSWTPILSMDIVAYLALANFVATRPDDKKKGPGLLVLNSKKNRARAMMHNICIDVRDKDGNPIYEDPCENSPIKRLARALKNRESLKAMRALVNSVRRAFRIMKYNKTGECSSRMDTLLTLYKSQITAINSWDDATLNGRARIKYLKSKYPKMNVVTLPQYDELGKGIEYGHECMTTEPIRVMQAMGLTPVSMNEACD